MQTSPGISLDETLATGSRAQPPGAGPGAETLAAHTNNAVKSLGNIDLPNILKISI